MAGTAGDAAGQEQADAGADMPGDGSGSGGDDTTLSEALEAFEKARGQGGSGDSSGDGFEAEDFPMILAEESAFPGEGLESGGGAQGDAESANTSGGAAGDAGSAMEAGAENDGGYPGDGPAQTTEEKLAVLDEELQRSYGQFEGMILRERGHVRDAENARGADIDPEEDSSGGGTTGGDGYAGGSGEYREPISGSGAGNRPENPDQREGDFEQVAVVNQVPPDIPDGSDDDVVARQLREAAMKETDPELREKLWEEYRKYKNKGS